MPDPALTPPLASREGPYQPGITSPAWPNDTPAGMDGRTYAAQYAGQLDRQRHCHIVFADVTVCTRAELRELLEKLTGFARHQMDKKPIQSDRDFDGVVPDRRVSVTIGFGASLFTTCRGDDRFGLAALKPRHLKILPRIDGDEDFDPAEQVTDLVVLVASDDMYVNEYIFGRLYYGGVHPGITVRRLERGYSRPDSREPSGFEDGLSNPKTGGVDRKRGGFRLCRRGRRRAGLVPQRHLSRISQNPAAARQFLQARGSGAGGDIRKSTPGPAPAFPTRSRMPMPRRSIRSGRITATCSAMPTPTAASCAALISSMTGSTPMATRYAASTI